MAEGTVAADQLRLFIERIERLEEEKKGIADDVRDVYAEAKANGFDKTTLGKLVLYVEKRGADAASVQEADALFDLYLEAYDAPHAHAPARTREIIDEFPSADTLRRPSGEDLISARPDSASSPDTGALLFVTYAPCADNTVLPTRKPEQPPN